MMNRVLAFAAASLAAATPAATVAPQEPASPAQRSTFVVLLAGDTLAVERVARTPRRVESDLTVRAQGVRLQFALTLAPAELVTSMDLNMRMIAAAPDAPPAQSATVTFRGDSAIVDVKAPARSTQRIAAGAGVLPLVNLSTAITEQLLRRARALGGPRVQLPTLPVGGRQVLPAVVTWSGSDTAVISISGVELRAAVSPDGRVLGAVIPAQRVTFVRLPAEERVDAAVRPADYSAPVGAPYTAEDLTFRTPEGNRLAGTLTIPKARDGPVPAVVLITGSGSQNRDEEVPGIRGYRMFRQIADTLSRRGIAVLRLDDRGIGGSEAGPQSTTGDFANDIRAALTYLRARQEIDGDRLGLVGHSEGGVIAPMVARDDPRLRAIALLAGPSRKIRDIVAFQRRVAVESDTSIAVSKRDSVMASMARAVDSMAAAPGWLRYIYDYDPLATARRVRTPVLILHGATDLQVTADQAPELAAAFREGGNRDVTVRVFPNTNHLFLDDPSGVYSGYATLPSKTVRAEVLGVLADWLVPRLGGAAR
jgi:uncharacterized protein